MSHESSPLKSVPSRRDQFRSVLLMVEIAVLLLAVVTQNSRPPLRDGSVSIERGMVFAASHDGVLSQALLPLDRGCTLHWNDGTVERSAAQYESSSVVFNFASRTLDYAGGDDRVTLTLDGGEITLWSECPPPQTEMAVYVQSNTLMMVDTESGVVTPLMPLRTDLLWSSTVSIYLTLDKIPAHMVEPDADWLPDDAELVGIFSTSTPVEVMTLDVYHMMLRTSGEDIVLLSY
jgi:hypothetical protein